MGLFEPRQKTKSVVSWLALTWLPLALLSILTGTAWGNKVRIPLLYDLSIYGRFFLALPLLITAEILIDRFVRQAVSTLNSAGIIGRDDLPSYHATLKRIARLRDSGLIELLLALLACVPYFLFVADYEWVSNPISTWHGTTSVGLSPAGWWFIFVASPFLRFLMLRWLWRCVLWSYLLGSISRLNLNLLPTHPDRLGGLSFLLAAQEQFGVLGAALGSVIAGQFANEIVHFGETLKAIKAPTGVFISLSVLIILLPLTFFSPRLFEARRDGLVRYSSVARSVTTAFDVKWARRVGSPPESMIGTQDPSSLIDYISDYDVIRETRVIPISRRAVLYVASLATAPFAVVWLLTSPLDKVIEEILKRLL